MEGIYFNLSGKTAFFKKPDVNINYFTYSNIHKVALLGLLGAIAGFAGYNSQKEAEIFPEFYDKLSKLKVSIAPKGDRGYFTKKIQVFNNSVGYANEHDGGNLIIKEQWLENPEWDIYLLNDGVMDKEDYRRLKDRLINGSCVYMPYLGKNDHAASIKNPRIIELEEMKETDHIDSLFPYNAVGLESYSYDDKSIYFYKEYLPFGLDEDLNSYMFMELTFTNRYIDDIKEKLCLLAADGKNLCFV